VSEPRLRLFVAVSVPETQLALLEEAVAPLRAELPHVRWAPLANQHITLKFLGWVDAARRGEVERAVFAAAAAHEDAAISLSGLGAFPTARRARVLWAGIDDPNGLLTSLAESLEKIFEPMGFERENRAYTPHLTLARIKEPTRVNLARIPVRSSAWRVATIELYRSHLSPRGARYEVVASAPIGTAATEGTQ
jgi:2'-5' RNA ligase